MRNVHRDKVSNNAALSMTESNGRSGGRNIIAEKSVINRYYIGIVSSKQSGIKTDGKAAINGQVGNLRPTMTGNFIEVSELQRKHTNGS